MRLFDVYMDGVMKMGMGRRAVSFMEDGREWRLLGNADDLVLCGELEEDLRNDGGTVY